MKIAQQIHNAFLEKKMTLGFAESCTGGALATSIVANPGASEYFLGSIVAYANAVKINLLDVDPLTLDQFGAVSLEVVCQMAIGACNKLGCNWAASVSGILGPTGGTIDKPVGTITAAIAHNGHLVHAWTMHLSGSRLELTQIATEEVLKKLFDFIK
ncbi:MAG: CinA family protein [Chlamydiales bacterium]|nr:CinA family protein [Chlamydiales bacterium]